MPVEIVIILSLMVIKLFEKIEGSSTLTVG